jgi:hypothetical protein
MSFAVSWVLSCRARKSTLSPRWVDSKTEDDDLGGCDSFASFNTSAGPLGYHLLHHHHVEKGPNYIHIYYSHSWSDPTTLATCWGAQWSGIWIDLFMISSWVDIKITAPAHWLWRCSLIDRQSPVAHW